uniref:Uncharacterized protein n=1 Tax=Cannabis sativa TaxID=3483 RepID=A0A803PS64_CANSA
MLRRLNSLKLNSLRPAKLKSLWLGNLWPARGDPLGIYDKARRPLNVRGQPSEVRVDHVEDEALEPWVLEFRERDIRHLLPLPCLLESLIKLRQRDSLEQSGVIGPIGLSWPIVPHPTRWHGQAPMDTEGVGNPYEDLDNNSVVKENSIHEGMGPWQCLAWGGTTVDAPVLIRLKRQESARPVKPPHASRDKGKATDSKENSDDSSSEDERLPNNPPDSNMASRMKNLVRGSSSGLSSGRPQAKELDADTLDYLIANTLKNVTSALLEFSHIHARDKGPTKAFKKKLESKDAKLKAKETELAEVQDDLDMTSTRMREELEKEYHEKQVALQEKQEYLDGQQAIRDEYGYLSMEVFYEGEKVLAGQTPEASARQPARALANKLMDVVQLSQPSTD